MKKRITYELYRIQQKVAMTRHELYALVCIVTFILIGAIVQSIQKKTPRFDASIYAEADSLFEAATLAMKQEEEKAGTDSLVTRASPDAEAITAMVLGGLPVNINTASQEELESLPRIGPAMAARIIDFRSKHGPFKSIDDLIQVKGIGPKTLERLRDRVTID